MLKVSTIFLFLLSYAVGEYPELMQPEREIKCPPVDQICEISLTVRYKPTLVADPLIPGVPDFGTPVTVNSSGGYEYVFDPSVRGTLKRLQPIDGDGITERLLYVINGQFPGPTIVGYTNQMVRIKVFNGLYSEAITIHWHGMHQIGTPYMDGVPYITQCPILPRNEFVYEFKLFPEGTFWYHSHVGAERSNGAYGALIVLPPQSDPANNDLIDMLGAHTILLDEWFLENSQEFQFTPLYFRDVLEPKIPFIEKLILTYDGSPAGTSPFIAGLINGAGWRYTPDRETCRRLTNTTLPTFEVTQGNRYRFRVINSQAAHNMRLSIQGHHLQLLATDGSNTKIPDSLPQKVDFITVNVAERYDFIVEANQAIDNYVVMVETLENPYELDRLGHCIKAHRSYAVLRYVGASSSLSDDFDSQYNPLERCNSTNECYAINCPFENYPSQFYITCINIEQLELVEPQPVPNDDVSDTVFLNFYEEDYIYIRLNTQALSFPPSPLLTQSEDVNPSTFCPYTQDLNAPNVRICTHTYTATTATVEMVLTNLGDNYLTSHPVHLHGHYFHVLHVGYPSYYANGTIAERNKDIYCATGDGYCDKGVSWSNGAPPSSCMESSTCPLKDTVTVPAGGYVWIRFARNNPGWWFLHCHIEIHLFGGMAIAINATSAPGDMNIPDNFPRCGNFKPSSTRLIQAPTSNQNVTTSLAIVCSLLLLALVIVTTVLVLMCFKVKKQAQAEKVIVEDTVPLQKVNSYEEDDDQS